MGLAGCGGWELCLSGVVLDGPGHVLVEFRVERLLQGGAWLEGSTGFLQLLKGW